MHAFITSHIDGCNTVLAGSPRTITDRLQRLLNAAARVVSNTRKFDRGLTYLLHSELMEDSLQNIEPVQLGVKQMCEASVELPSITDDTGCGVQQTL